MLSALKKIPGEIGEQILKLNSRHKHWLLYDFFHDIGHYTEKCFDGLSMEICSYHIYVHVLQSIIIRD